MYSYQIEQILESNNFSIPSDTYMNICSTSPQITRIKYEPYDNFFEMWANDGYWKFSVYRKED